MAPVSPTAYVQALSHPADSFRRAIQGALRGGYGVETWSPGGGDMLVTANGTPNMSVNVAAGRADIPNSQNTVYGGSYNLLNDATYNVGIAAADATNPRNDLVVASQPDAQYSGTNNTPTIQVITGTPAPTPLDPTVPPNSIQLARVRVNAGVTSITSGVITDLRVALATTAQLTGQILQATGLAGASSAVSRFVGAVSGAAPSAGTFNVGDVVADVAGFLRFCSAAGTPGTWLPSGMTKVAEVTLGANATSVIFSSIPSSFRHLMLQYQGSTNGAGALYMNLNNDLTADYNYVNYFTNNNATSLTVSNASAASQWNPGVGGQSACGGLIWLPNYAVNKGQGIMLGLAFGQSPAPNANNTQVSFGSWQYGLNPNVISRIELGAQGFWNAGSILSLFAVP